MCNSYLLCQLWSLQIVQAPHPAKLSLPLHHPTLNSTTHLDPRVLVTHRLGDQQEDHLDLFHLLVNS